MKTFLRHNLRRINIQYTNLGRQDQIIILRNIISGRAKTISVKHSTHIIPVSKED